MKYTLLLQETFLDYPDNVSNALAIIMPGCAHNCPGCQSPHLQSPIIEDENALVLENDLEVDNFIKNEIPNRLVRICSNKIVLTGGDCLSLYNRELSRKILQQKIENAKYKDVDICIYTGYTFSLVSKFNLPPTYKYIKCGRYIKELAVTSKKTDDYFQLASPNQEFYRYDHEKQTYIKISENGRINF